MLKTTKTLPIAVGVVLLAALVASMPTASDNAVNAVNAPTSKVSPPHNATDVPDQTSNGSAATPQATGLSISDSTTLTSLLAHKRTFPFAKLIIMSTDFMNFALTQAEKIVAQVLDDPTVSGVSSEVMREELSGLGLFAQQAKNSRRLVAAVDASVRSHFLLVGTKSMMVTKFMGIVKRHNSTLLAQRQLSPSEEEKLLERALQQHGLPQYEQQLREHEVHILQVLYDSVKAYLDTLTPAQRTQEQAMVEWYDKYRNVLDTTRKNEIFKHYSQLYAHVPEQSASGKTK